MIEPGEKPVASLEQSAKPRTISETLAMAERDHLLDCPTADFMTRCAATALDSILMYLLLSSTQNFFEALREYFPGEAFMLTLNAPSWVMALWKSGPSGLNYLSSVAKIGFLYLYSIWSISRFGGTPGKLLLGLRVLDETNGHFLPIYRVVLREFVARPLSFISLGLGIVCMLVRKDRRTLHDALTRSVVKRVHEDL